MKAFRTSNCIALLFAAVIILGTVQMAVAAGTASNTPISNTATVDYSVNGVDQDQETSTISFVVDNKVDLTVTCDLANVTVLPNQQNKAIPFTITNTGNTKQSYKLDVVDGTTEISMSSVEIYFDADGDGLLDEGESLYVNDGSIQVPVDNPSLKVLIVADAPNSSTINFTDTYHLKVTTLNAGTSTVTLETSGEDTANVDVVFADGEGSLTEANDGDDQYDGVYSASGIYTFANAALNAEKISVVHWDPYNEYSNPKAIPGAKVEYRITVTNNGTATADSIVISDDLTTEISNNRIEFVSNAYNDPEIGYGIKLTAPDNTITYLTNGVDGDNGKLSSNKVIIDNISLAPNESTTASFQVLIK